MFGTTAMLDISTESIQLPDHEPINTRNGGVYLQEFEPCILPPIGQDANGLVQPKYMTIALEAKIPLESFYRGLGIELFSFFKTVWLLVLSQLCGNRHALLWIHGWALGLS